MFLEYWQIALLIVVCGLWSEDRFRKGFNNGSKAGYNVGVKYGIEWMSGFVEKNKLIDEDRLREFVKEEIVK